MKQSSRWVRYSYGKKTEVENLALLTLKGTRKKSTEEQPTLTLNDLSATKKDPYHRQNPRNGH
jgi:hypothetical protein